jgi:hypothetical protein
MMAHSKDISNIQTINGIREVRLERALGKARQIENQAEIAEVAAHVKAKSHAIIAADARVAAYADPSCTQTRFWREIAKERRADAEKEAEAATLERVEASQMAALCAQEMRRHKVKMDRVEELRRVLRRQENQILEVRDEDEALMLKKGRVQ